jgi:hypothetical protein
MFLLIIAIMAATLLVATLVTIRRTAARAKMERPTGKAALEATIRMENVRAHWWKYSIMRSIDDLASSCEREAFLKMTEHDK